MTTNIYPTSSVVIEGNYVDFLITTDLPAGNYPFSVFTDNVQNLENFTAYDGYDGSAFQISQPGIVRIGPYYYINFGFYVLRVGPAPGEGSIRVYTNIKGSISAASIPFKIYLGTSGSIAISSQCTMTRVSKKFGFLATNDSSLVLIDSATKNLFFLGKATYVDVLQSHIMMGKMRRLRYTITSPKPPMPFFTATGRNYIGLTRITNTTGNTWEIELIVSGDITSFTFSNYELPQVYVFIEYDDILNPVGPYGMIVYNETSGVTFDSRLKPLLVTATTTVTPPTSPFTHTDADMSKTSDHGSGRGVLTPDDPTYNMNSGMIPDNYLNYYAYNLTTPSKPIYFYSSVSQTQRNYTQYENLHYFWCEVDDKIFGSGCIVGKDIVKYVTCKTSGFYRSGIKPSFNSSTTLTIASGWIGISGGNSTPYRFEKDTGYWGGFPDYNSQGGGNEWPFKNATINNGSGNSVIVLDGAKYD